MTIYEMLSISEQSTWQEVSDAYRRERVHLLHAKPCNAEEAEILCEKCSILEKAYEDSRENYRSGSVPPVTAFTYSKKLTTMQSTKLYSIPGPFFCLTECCDGSGCISPCNEDCWRDVYRDCDVLRWADTIIVGGAGITAVIAVFVGVFKGISSISSSRRHRKMEKIKTRRVILAEEIKHGKSTLQNLQRLNVVTHALEKIPTGKMNVDDEFSMYAVSVFKMLNSVETNVKRLEEERVSLDRKLAKY